jgi:hypothetical protein
VPILGLWLDGAFYFVTGETTRKGKNLAGDPRCVIAASSTTLPPLDVVLEGEARKVTADATLQLVVDANGSKMEWPLEVRDTSVIGPNAPTAGPPPYAVYELAPTTVLGLPGIAGTEPGQGVGARGRIRPNPLAALGSGRIPNSRQPRRSARLRRTGRGKVAACFRRGVRASLDGDCPRIDGLDLKELRSFADLS